MQFLFSFRLSFLLCCFLFGTTDLFAQLLPAKDVPNLNGHWAGKLYQQEGGFASEFEFWLEIKQDGYSAEGTSSVYYNDIAAAISFVAKREANGAWLFTEIKVIDSRKPEHLEWCYKQYRLRIEFATDGSIILTGPWWGASKSGRCVPGHIILRKSLPRA